MLLKKNKAIIPIMTEFSNNFFYLFLLTKTKSVSNCKNDYAFTENNILKYFIFHHIDYAMSKTTPILLFFRVAIISRISSLLLSL